MRSISNISHRARSLSFPTENVRKMSFEMCIRDSYTLLEQDSNYAPVRTRPNGEDRSIKELSLIHI